MRKWNTIRAVVFGLVILSALLSFTSCIAQKRTVMEYKPDKFSKVLINSNQASECSPPEQLPNWRGVLINSPETVVLSASAESASIPICGYYQLGMDKLDESGPLRFVVRQKETDSVYRGIMLQEDSSPEEPHPDGDRKPSAAQMKNMAVGAYFNPNLLDYVKMPTTPGQYEVYAEYAGSKSNTANFRIELR